MQFLLLLLSLLSFPVMAGPIYLTEPIYPLILVGQVELNYEAPYLWIRFSTAGDSSSTRITKYCYKVNPTTPPAVTNGWMTLFYYWLGGPWASNMQPMTAADKAKCWPPQ